MNSFENGILIVALSENTKNIQMVGSFLLSTNNDGVCDVDNTLNYDYLPPLKQFKIGIVMDRIQCNEDLLLIKKYDGSPACVFADTATKLAQNGWEVQTNYRKTTSMSNSNKDHHGNSMLSIRQELINGREQIVFQGSGWLKLHSVEITINSELEKIISMKTQTNESGVLYLPWILPDDLPKGTYQIDATDGIHQKKIRTSIPVQNAIGLEIAPDLEIEIIGDKQVRRGTTHILETLVHRDRIPVQNAIVFITIEDYGENIIREFKGRTNQDGIFVFSWEIPKKFNDIETLLAIVDVTDGISSKTEIFKFIVYCLPGELGCKVEGN